MLPRISKPPTPGRAVRALFELRTPGRALAASFAPPRSGALTSAAFIFGLVAAALVTHGYAVGVHDHNIHLVFLKRALDETFLRGDLLADAAPRHASFFWRLQVPLVARFGLEPTYFALYLLSWAATFGGLICLARDLAPRGSEHEGRRAGWVACALAVLGAPTFAAIHTFDNHVLNRTVALGPELFALALAARGRAVASLFALGLLCNVHVTTAAHGAVLATCALAVDRDRWRKLGIGVASFALGASPLLFAHFAAAPAGAAYPRWREAVTIAFPFHHFLDWMAFWQWLALAVPLAFVGAALRLRFDARFAALAGGVVLLVIANAVATEVLHLRVGVMLHLYEATRFLNYLAFIAFGRVILHFARTPGRRALAAVLATLTVGYLVGDISRAEEITWPIDTVCGVALVVLLGAVALTAPREPLAAAPPPRARWLVLATALAALLTRSRQGDDALISPRLDAPLGTLCTEELPEAERTRPPREACGFALMDWARDALPRDARVVLPPYFVHPLTGFRYRAERVALVTFKDGGEATFDDVFAREWMDRIAALAGPISAAPPGDPIGEGFDTTFQQIQSGYASIDATRLAAVRDRYGMTHAVCVRSAACGGDLPVVYEDGVFKIVQLSR